MRSPPRPCRWSSSFSPSRSGCWRSAAACCAPAAGWPSSLPARSCAAPPAALEPLATRGHFHSDAELAALGRQAGLAEVKVHNDGGGQLLTAHI